MRIEAGGRWGAPAAAIALAAVAWGWLGGCDGGAPAGNVLRGNMNAEPQTLNPLTSRDVYASIIHDFIFESLIDRDPDTFEFRGELADRWEVSGDGRTVTFHIHPDAAFSDGHPVTADDVVFTFEMMRNPEVDATRLASYFKDCEGCDRVDERTVRFRWKEKYFKTLEVSGAFLNILPKHVYEPYREPEAFNRLSREPLVGSGPYVFESWETGSRLTLGPNQAYWREQPAIERIQYRFILEPRAETQAFLSGDLDRIAVSPEWWFKLKDRNPEGTRFQMFRYSTPGSGYAYIGWNNAREPFTDARVRRAMTHLIDREQILEHLYRGIGRIVTGPFWIESPQYDQSIEPWPYDPAEARRLLGEAGWDDRDGDGWLENAEDEPFAFQFETTADNPIARDLAGILEREFQGAGIRMTARFTEWSVFVTKLDNRDYDAVMLGWSGTIEGDPYQIWHSSQIEGRGSNHVGFDNPEADRLILEARAELDPDRRNALYHRFHRLLHREQPYTFLRGGEALACLSNRVKGVTVHRLGLEPRQWYLEGYPRQGESAAP